MRAHPSESIPVSIQEVQNARLWCTSILERIYGPKKGGEILLSLDPMMVVSLWVYLLDESLDADES